MTASKEIKPIYVIFGSDEFLRSEARHAITANVIGDADSQLCVSIHEPPCELADVMDDLRTLPFLAPRRLVIINDADSFISDNRGFLEDYLDKPAESGTLLLCAKSFPGNTRLAKKVAKVGEKVDCSAPDDKDLPNTIKRLAGQKDRKIDSRAASLLATWIGADMGRVNSELDKLSLLTEGRKSAEITAADVEELVASTAGASPWALTDALDEGNAAKALKLLEKIVTRPGEEFQVLGLIGWRLRRVIKAAQMISAGHNEQQVFKELRIFRQSQTNLRNLLHRRSISRLSRDFRELIRTDLAMKSGRDGKAALQRLIVSLC